MQSPPSSVAPHGGAEHLVRMANDIGNFFRSEPDRKDGIAGIANHIAKFWTPRMRQKLFDHVKEHGVRGSTSCRARRSNCSRHNPAPCTPASLRAATRASLPGRTRRASVLTPRVWVTPPVSAR